MLSAMVTPDPIEPPRLDPETGLSNAPVHEVGLPGGKTLRLDEQGRLLCKAKRKDGELCKSPTVTGMLVCRLHGGRSPQARNAVKLRLAELVQPALATLAREMVNADKSADMQRAANSILDRAGVSRVQRIETEDAKEILLQRILELRAGIISDDQSTPEEETE